MSFRNGIAYCDECGHPWSQHCNVHTLQCCPGTCPDRRFEQHKKFSREHKERNPERMRTIIASGAFSIIMIALGWLLAWLLRGLQE